MTDGLPVVPPSRERVERMLAGTGRDRTELVGEVAPNYGRATVEKVAVNAVINFLIVAFAVFLLVQQVNRLFPKPAAPAAPAMKDCSWCSTSIPAAAKRCPHCTSNLT